jgi:hypothetical protein
MCGPSSTLSQRAAYKTGLARTLSEAASGNVWQPTLPETIAEGQQQRRGRKFALHALKEMGADVGQEFLRRYEGHEGFATALGDFGGYESQLPPPKSHPLDRVSSLVGAAKTAWKVGSLADAWPGMPKSLSAGSLVLKAMVGAMNALGNTAGGGETAAVRNAYNTGFARTLAEAANGAVWQPTLPGWADVGQAQWRGRSDALDALKGMGAEAGQGFVRRYAGPDGFAQALGDLGGYQ